jgi:hypothetical protein
MTQDNLNNYFSTVWQSDLNRYKYSGWALIDKIKSGEQVIDIGCGFNEFKPHIPNLIGIDPANDLADYKISIEEFNLVKQYDVAFCLGSINFGNEANILNQIGIVVNALKPTARIYWRCNPGSADHPNEECKTIDFYPWTIEKHVEFSELFGFKLDLVCWDNANRIYAEWSRQSNT